MNICQHPCGLCHCTLKNWKILEGYWIPTSMHWHDICDPHLRMMVTLHNHEINGLEPRIPKRNHKSLIRMCFTPIIIFWNTHCFVNFASPKKWYTHLKKNMIAGDLPKEKQHTLTDDPCQFSFDWPKPAQAWLPPIPLGYESVRMCEDFLDGTENFDHIPAVKQPRGNSQVELHFVVVHPRPTKRAPRHQQRA